ncbi:MAG TPA: RnfABCDGE type electron transport complex subunit D [Planctomycetota bacterium]|nr:RnfABCDGE type electron transport complex subunit D [Planctomycetota bacterium]
MARLVVSTSPHIRAEESIPTIMWTVVLALTLPGMFGVYIFGTKALLLIAISVAAAVVTEHVIQKLRGKRSTIGDGSALVTGLLLAYVISPGAAWYVPLIGSVFAIAVVKFAFGGLGMNIWNPALMGRAFVMSAYILLMTASWIYPRPQLILGELRRGGEVLHAGPEATTTATKKLDPQVFATTTATPRAAVRKEILDAKDPDWDGWKDIKTAGSKPSDWLHRIYERNKTSYLDLFIGTRGGCIGETGSIWLILGGLFLLYRRIIYWQVPAFCIGTVALLSWALPVKLAYGTAWFAGDPLFAILSGGLMLGAFFMATDMVTSPVTKKGMAIFGIGCGVLTVIIRNYGGYPEGVCYAILLMNTAVPLIDRYVKPRKYGATA